MKTYSFADTPPQDYIAYSNAQIAILEDIRLLSDPGEQVTVDAYAVLLCLSGEARLHINAGDHIVRTGDMHIFHPNIVLSRTTFSGDFSFRCIALSPEYAERLSILSKRSWEMRRYLEQNPLLHLEETDVHTFFLYYDLLLEKLRQPPVKYHDKLIESLVSAFIYEFFETLERHVDIRPMGYSSGEMIFERFITLLDATHPHPRNVTWYADQLNLTPKYLYSVCKQISGHSASTFIHHYVVRDIRTLLQRRDLTIKEVSNALQFPTLSFFGKYVRQHFGISPRQYREKLLRQPQAGDEATTPCFNGTHRDFQTPNKLKDEG